MTAPHEAAHVKALRGTVKPALIALSAAISAISMGACGSGNDQAAAGSRAPQGTARSTAAAVNACTLVTAAEVEAQTGPTIQVKPGIASGLCDYLLQGPGNQYFAAGTHVLVTVSAYVACAVCTPLQSYEAQDPAALPLSGIGDKALFSDRFGVVFYSHGQIVEISGSFVGKSGGGSSVLPGQKELEIAIATDAVKVLGG